MNEANAAPRRSGAYALLVASGILLSRVAGLVRGAVLARFLGTTAAATAFAAALRIPNFLQNLLGEGVLSASMIPVYSRLLAQNDRETAGRVAGVVASLLALLTAALVLVGVLCAPFIVDVLAAGFEGELRALTIRLVRILFPGIGLLVLSAWCLAVLNSHRMFFVPYVAPVLWNAAIIGALLLFGWGERTERIAEIASWGVLVGGALQLGVQIPFVLRHSRRLRFSLSAIPRAARQVFRNFVPALFARGVVQISAFIDEFLGSFLGEAALGAIGGYAYPIYLLPVSLFGMSVSAAELPQMSSVTGSLGEIGEKLRERLHRALRQITFFVVPSLVALLAIGDRLVAGLYQRGMFTDQSTIYVWYIVVGYSIGLVPVTLGRLYSSAFYSLNDTRTPLRCAIVRVVLTAGLGALLAFPLRPLLVQVIAALGPLPRMNDAELALGAVGLAAASGIVGWVEFALLRSALGRRIPPIPVERGFVLRVAGSALAAGTIASTVVRLGLADLPPIVSAVSAAAIFGGAYLGLAAALRLPEARRVLRFVRPSRG